MRHRFHGTWNRWSVKVDQFLVSYPRLMWLRKWLDDLVGWLTRQEAEIESLENWAENLEGLDTKTANVTVINDFALPVDAYDPLSETYSAVATDTKAEIEVDVNISKAIERKSIGTPPNQVISWEADNAIEVNNDGLYVPDVMEALDELSDQISSTTERTLTGATFNTLSSFGLSYTGLNYQSFFEKETGVYFAYGNFTTQGLSTSTFTSNVLAVFDKTGNLLSFIRLHPLAGHTIGNIINLFVSYSKVTGNYFIEIGCDNESAFAFMANKNLVYSNTLNLDKNIDITEFTSFETFNTIIGSSNTAIPTSGTDVVEWYAQIVTIWNTQSNTFTYGTRSNFYNGSFLTAFNPDSTVEITATTPVIGASADYYGNLITAAQTPSGQQLTFYNASQSANTLTQLISRAVVYPTTGGEGTTLLTYTKKLGTLEVLNSATDSPALYGCQILNQSKDASVSTMEWTILLNHAQEGINDSSTNFVSGFGNSSQAIYYQLVNSDELAIGDLLQISNNYNHQLAGLSMFGEFNISRNPAYGSITIQSMNDTPDKQANLLIEGYSAALVFGFSNSKVAINRFTQTLNWRKPANNASGAPFDNTVLVEAKRRVSLAVSYPSVATPGSIGEWTVYDLDQLNNRQLKTQNTNSIDMGIVGDWLTGDEVETVSANANISNANQTISLPNFGGVINVPNGTAIKSDGLWSPDYAAALQNINKYFGGSENAINAINLFGETQTSAAAKNYAVNGADPYTLIGLNREVINTDGTTTPVTDEFTFDFSSLTNGMAGGVSANNAIKLNGADQSTASTNNYPITNSEPYALVELKREVINADGTLTPVTDYFTFDFSELWAAAEAGNITVSGEGVITVTKTGSNYQVSYDAANSTTLVDGPFVASGTPTTVHGTNLSKSHQYVVGYSIGDAQYTATISSTLLSPTVSDFQVTGMNRLAGTPNLLIFGGLNLTAVETSVGLDVTLNNSNPTANPWFWSGFEDNGTYLPDLTSVTPPVMSINSITAL